MKKLLVILLIGTPVLAWCQEKMEGFNPNSVNPIHESDIMFKKRIWRRMDLLEKQNKPFFAMNNELTKFIIDAVINGDLQPYMNDSLVRTMTKAEFLENMKDPLLGDVAEEGGSADDPWGSGTGGDGWGSSGDAWGDSGTGFGDAATGEKKEKSSSAANIYLLPTQTSVVEVVEDLIFDRHRSRMYWDLQAITLKIPAKYDPAGLERRVASFKYKDLEKLFRNNPEKAIWFNPQNSAAHLNFADAFLLRMFHARIIKIANPSDNYIADIYLESQEAALNASIDAEYDLVEMENEMWEY